MSHTHPTLLEALEEARLQIEILQDRLGIKETGSGSLSIIDAALANAKVFWQHEQNLHESSGKTEAVARFLARENGAPHYGEDDWAIWVPQANSVLAMAAPAAVTDAMIDRGLACYSEGGCSGLAEHERREVVASIIEAALSEGKP